MIQMETTELEMDLGHIFVDEKLLERALTTNGWANEHNKLINKGIEDSGVITKEKKDVENRKTLFRISRKFNELCMQYVENM